jgi:hypothetical protein
MSFSLLAAVPSHSGSIVVEGAATLVDVQAMVLKRGGSFRFHHESGATISLVRNAIVAEFLASGADLLLMLDADQAVHPGTIARMIDLQKPFVGCIYPQRRYDWSRANLATAKSTEQLVAQSLRYVGWLVADAHGQSTVIDGCAPAEHVGTGILLLRREVFLRLMGDFPELQGRGFGEDAYPQYNGGGRWGFFNPLENEEGVPLSEDISFCRRWRQIGGEIWADVMDTTVHVGRHPFAGSLSDQANAFRRT